jgi:hypothetical protein
VVLIAHGPNDEEENRLWLRDMKLQARFLRERGGFRGVDVLTHRNDAPAPVKAEARAAFRQRRHFNDTARQCGFGPDMEGIVEDVVSRMPNVAEEVANRLPQGFPEDLFVAVTDGMRRSAERLR